MNIRFFNKNSESTSPDQKNEKNNVLDLSDLDNEASIIDATVRVSYWFARRLFPINYESLKEIGMGTAIGVIQFPLNILISTLETKWYGGSGADQPGRQHIRSSRGNLQIFIPPMPGDLPPPTRFAICIRRPLVEEIFFRGIVMQGTQYILEKAGLKSKNATIGSIFASSLLFSRLHAPGARASTFIGGMIFGSLTAAYDSRLWASSAAHITNNTVAEGLDVVLRRRR